MKEKDINRFWGKVDKTNSCWMWMGTIHSTGYGHFKLDKKNLKAHRISYLLTYGDFPVLPLDHLCRNRACVNPIHLEPVSHRVNILRGIGPAAILARRTKCNKGHLFSDFGRIRIENNRNNPSRRCVMCVRETSKYATRRYRARRKESCGITTVVYK